MDGDSSNPTQAAQHSRLNKTRRRANSHFTGSRSNALHASAPFPFLNPTTRYHPITLKSAVPQAGEERTRNEPLTATAARRTAKDVYHVWRSRDNRKGRHAAVVVRGREGEGEGILTPSATNTLAETWKGIVKMVIRWPVWDVSFDVAVVFTFGSVVWVINGFMVLLPLVEPWSAFPNEAELGGGVSAFIGATIFEFGSVLYMLEAINENRSDCFGWALEEVLEDNHSRCLRKDDEHCHHHHCVKHAWLRASRSGSSVASPGDTASGKKTDDNTAQPQEGHVKSDRRWSWWPTHHELTSHYLNDIGFLACLSQMIGATVFWISGFTGLPPIFDSLEPITGAVNGIFWLPQVIGGTGFIISSGLFMIEVQERWYKPALGILGWHIGLWNLVGAIGFTLCGALGFGSEASEGVEYGSILSTFIGSWAFLIGSLIQWYESLDKYPISVGAVPRSLQDDKGTP